VPTKRLFNYGSFVTLRYVWTHGYVSFAIRGCSSAGCAACLRLPLRYVTVGYAGCNLRVVYMVLLIYRYGFAARFDFTCMLPPACLRHHHYVDTTVLPFTSTVLFCSTILFCSTVTTFVVVTFTLLPLHSTFYSGRCILTVLVTFTFTFYIHLLFYIHLFGLPTDGVVVVDVVVVTLFVTLGVHLCSFTVTLFTFVVLHRCVLRFRSGCWVLFVVHRSTRLPLYIPRFVVRSPLFYVLRSTIRVTVFYHLHTVSTLHHLPLPFLRLLPISLHTLMPLRLRYVCCYCCSTTVRSTYRSLFTVRSTFLDFGAFCTFCWFVRCSDCLRLFYHTALEFRSFVRFVEFDSTTCVATCLPFITTATCHLPYLIRSTCLR